MVMTENLKLTDEQRNEFYTQAVNTGLNGNRRILTTEQIKLLKELTEAHDLDVSQISFEGESTEPIFDYEALNVLRLKLTDLQDTHPEIVERNSSLGIVTARCTVTLTDGRTASDLGSAEIGESMPSGRRLETFMQAEPVALARAFRRALRSGGINLLKAHKNFMETGEIVSGDIDAELATKIGKEIHALANEWGHIHGKDKTTYQEFIERIFGEGKRSTLDLNDIEKSQLANMYRQMLNSRNLSVLESQKLAA